MSRIAHLLSGIAFAATTLGLTTPAQAQQTIECRSNNYGYNECYAGDLSSPQLIHQTSSSACIPILTPPPTRPARLLRLPEEPHAPAAPASASSTATGCVGD